MKKIVDVEALEEKQHQEKLKQMNADIYRYRCEELNVCWLCGGNLSHTCPGVFSNWKIDWELLWAKIRSPLAGWYRTIWVCSNCGEIDNDIHITGIGYSWAS